MSHNTQCLFNPQRAPARLHTKTGIVLRKLTDVTIGDQTITGKLKTPDVAGNTVTAAPRVEPTLAQTRSKYDVPLRRVVENNFLRGLMS